MASVSANVILNKAVFDYVMVCIEHGDVDPLYEMGLSSDDLTRMQNIKNCELMRLVNSKANVLDFKIDSQRLNNMLNMISKETQTEEHISLLIKNGAPQTMLNSLYAITPSQYTSKRKLHGITNEGVERSKDASEEQLEAIYNDFKLLQKDVSEVTPNEWIGISKTAKANLRIVWQVVQRMAVEA